MFFSARFFQTRCVRVYLLGLHFLACASESSKSFCHVERTVKLTADPLHKYDTHQVLMFGSGVMRSRECVDDRDEAFLPLNFSQQYRTCREQEL